MSEIITVKNDFLAEKYDKVVASSGLTVYVFPKQLTTTYAAISVPFGSLDSTFRFADEEEMLTLPDGIAHFLEHKMFESEDHVDTFDKFAAVGASANAYTSNELTSYLFTTHDDVEPPLRILLDYVFKPYFTAKNVEKEVGIVGQEIKMYEDSSGSRLYHSMMELLYQVHGIRTKIAGSLSSISAITPELLMRCHRAYYRPERMTLIVCGNVTTEEILAVVEEVTPHLPSIPEVIPEVVTEPDGIAEKMSEFHMDIARPKICIGLKDKLPEGTAIERERRAIAMNILCDLYFGTSSPFFERLYAEGLISRDFSSYYESLRDIGHMLFSAATDDPMRLLSELRAEMARIIAAPTVAEEDFMRIRNVHYAEFIKGFDDTEEIASALLDAVVEGTALFDDGDIIQSITPEDIYALARDILIEDNLAYTVVYPTKGKEEHA